MNARERTSRDGLTGSAGLKAGLPPLTSNSRANLSPRRKLPGRLRNPGDFSLKRQAAEAQTADAELAQKRPRTSADVAAVVLAAGEFGFLVRLGDTGCLSHRFLYYAYYAVPAGLGLLSGFVTQRSRAGLILSRPAGSASRIDNLSNSTAVLPYSKLETLFTDHCPVRNGIPMCFNSARAWSSLPAVVTIVIFIPRIFSTLE